MRRPVVISPIAPLLRRDGLEVALVSIELWPEETIVRLAAIVDDVARREVAHEAALDTWARGDRSGAPPAGPAEPVYAGLAVSLTDDLGTEYRPRSTATGGTGRLFRGDWHFLVGVPDEASRLVVEASYVDGPHGSVELSLEPNR